MKRSYVPPYLRKNASHTSRPTNNYNGRLGQSQSNAFSRNVTSDVDYLKQIHAKSDEEILTEFSQKNVDFLKWMQGGNDVGEKVYLLMGIFSKIVSSPFHVHKAAILSRVCKGAFFKELFSFILLLPSQSGSERTANKTLWNNIDKFLMNVIIFCSCLFDVVPTSAVEIVTKLISTAQLTINNLERESLKIADEVKQQLSQLNEKLQECVKEFEKTGKPPTQIEPPNDFRQISIYPTSEEILHCTESFLRANKVAGSYNDVNEYLDIQFRLLREDFVKPLKEGINEYIMQQNGANVKKRISNVKVYKNVTFLEVVNVSGEIGRKVQLNKHGNYSKGYNSKRLMYGSLVCFTRDYSKTLLFGRIICTDEKFAKDGQIIVYLHANAEESPGHKYIMVEFGVYFEPYYVVLKALQQLEIERFPLKQFIVDVSTLINCPNYLKGIEEKLEDYHSIKNKLNAMQQEAFTAALTRELVIIQGPPGTGKTHLGLEIVKTIYAYRRTLKNDAESISGPIFILCYTNHALDQFLEGILKFTACIVRVGGQSKCEALKPYNLKELYRHCGRNQLLEGKKHELIDIALKIKKINRSFDVINHHNGVINFGEFINIHPEFENSWFFNKDPYAITRWLCGKINMLNYIEQNEFNLDENEQNTSDGQILTTEETSGAESRTDSANNLIEIHSGFDGIDSQELDLRLTFDVIENQQTLNNLKIQHKTEFTKFIQSDKKNKQALYNMRMLERNITNREEITTYIQLRLLEGKRWKVKDQPKEIDLRNPNRMSANDRWRLYFSWLDLYKKWAEERVNILVKEYVDELKEYEEQKAFEDVKLMRDMDIIGMTTTGAARLQSTLQALKCPIVVVEEAAEILESHIVASLTKDCQHLILIGDHQQLRPTTADYSIEKNMKLGISLFERFIINNFDYSTLNIQHRMRPEISSLISPSIYPDLINHDSVLSYPPVNGVKSSLYFIDHSESEEPFGDSSKQNPHEAKFLVRLAEHLLKNRCKAMDITILVAYLGQYYAIKEEAKNRQLNDKIRCAVLDNYQGEENKIILLSLVRSNNENSIGFLKIENRVCVALSRAKEGLYIMGNMELLCRNSKIWPKIKDVLITQNALGKELPLCCQNHKDHTIKVKHPSDFDQAVNGCCGQVCGFKLACGHTCKRTCHLNDPSHTHYLCKQRCLKVFCDDESHLCRKRCHQTCGTCIYTIDQTLNCGHTNKIPCFQKEQPDLKCQFPCDKRIKSCGHICTLKCHINDDPEHEKYNCNQPCSKDALNCSSQEQKHSCTNSCYEKCKPCCVMVKKLKTLCKHLFEVPCSKNADDYIKICNYPCDKLLQCGHKCSNMCGESCSTRCAVEVEKVYSACGHKIMWKCSDNTFESKVPCEQIVDLDNEAACGHKFKVPCHFKQRLKPDDPDLLTLCPTKCATVLACGHTCTGTCRECFQGRLHKSCTVVCGKTLICGHTCPLSCGKPCEPCFQNCNFLCVHKECNELCGGRCFRCKKKCPRACQHAKCSSKCGNQNCTVPPCEEPCRKVFKCGHRCIGFCGDVCPTTCKICDGEEIDENARYIVLEECGHVFEVERMKRLMQEHSVGIRLCPMCNTRLNKTHRLKEYILEGIKQQQHILKEIYHHNFKETYDKHTKFITGNSRIIWRTLEELEIITDGTVTTLTEKACLDFKDKITQSVLNCLRFSEGRVCSNNVYEFLETNRNFFDTPIFTLQETMNILQEYKRCINKLGLCIIFQIKTSKPADLMIWFQQNQNRLSNEQKELTEKLLPLLLCVREFTDEDDAAAKELLKLLDTKNTLKNMISTEPLELPDILSYSTDSWFKCSEGHLNSCYNKSKEDQKNVCEMCKNKESTDSEEEMDNIESDNRFLQYSRPVDREREMITTKRPHYSNQNRLDFRQRLTRRRY